ncbi:MAG: ribonuclease HI [Planctomycetes bacterium]|nr:ribonuclease HI [Planctomycetota bacterium]
MERIQLFTDGACIGNPGPGGYGVVLVGADGRRELSGGFRRTTNNRMEIYAAIAALRALERPATGVLYSDSRYVVDSIAKRWAIGWRAKNWMRTKTERALNSDLWELVLALLEPHDVRFQWVRGHAGHRENERCDELATTAARGRELAIDAEYERPSAARASGLFDA